LLLYLSRLVRFQSPPLTRSTPLSLLFNYKYQIHVRVSLPTPPVHLSNIRTGGSGSLLSVTATFPLHGTLFLVPLLESHSPFGNPFFLSFFGRSHCLSPFSVLDPVVMHSNFFCLVFIFHLSIPLLSPLCFEDAMIVSSFRRRNDKFQRCNLIVNPLLSVLKIFGLLRLFTQLEKSPPPLFFLSSKISVMPNSVTSARRSLLYSPSLLGVDLSWKVNFDCLSFFPSLLYHSPGLPIFSPSPSSSSFLPPPFIFPHFLPTFNLHPLPPPPYSVPFSILFPLEVTRYSALKVSIPVVGYSISFCLRGYFPEIFFPPFLGDPPVTGMEPKTEYSVVPS